MIRRSGTSKRNIDSEAGFTLVELLVGLALFSLLSILLFDNVRFGLRAWRNGSANADALDHSMISQDLLRRTIGNLYPMIVADGAMQPQIDFAGTKEAVDFLSNAPTVAGGAGRFRFKVFVDRRQDEADLVMTSAPELSNPRDASMRTRTLLLPAVDRVEFAYFGEAGSERGPQWKDDWSKRSDIPGLIRVRVSFRSGDRRSWPELVIAPRVRADVSCVYDPITMRCRGR
jgi:general secretion pathway protein J